MANTATNYKPQSGSALYWAISDSWLMAKRSIMHIIRSVDQVMSVALFPIMFLILNRYVLGGAINTGGIDYSQFIFAGILVQMLAFGANYTTINLAVDLQQGIVDRFRSLPMNTGALLFGHISADIFRNALSTVIIFIASLIVGFRPNATVGEWLLVIALSLVFTMAISWISALLGLFVKTIEAAQWIGFVFIFPLTFVSSAFVPTQSMPHALQIFAKNQPLTHVVNAVRYWTIGEPALGDSGWLAFAWCIGIILVSAPIAIWLFNSRGKR